jgi:hypothetical protein
MKLSITEILIIKIVVFTFPINDPLVLIPNKVDLSDGGDQEAQKRYIELETNPLL